MRPAPPSPPPAPAHARAGSPVPGGIWRGSAALGVGRLAGTAATAIELVVASRRLDGATFGRLTFLLAALVLVEALADLGTGAAALQRGAADDASFARALATARRARRWPVAGAALLLLALGCVAGAHPGWTALACLLPLSRLSETSGLVFQRALLWSPLVGARLVGAIARGLAVPLLLFAGVREVGLLLAAHAAGLALGNLLVHLAARARGLLPAAAVPGPARELWRLALPLGCATLVHQAALYADNWLLLSLRGEVELGWYNAAARVASFLLLFAANAGIVALPWLAARGAGGGLAAAAGDLSRALVLPAALVLGLVAPHAEALLHGAFGAPFGAGAGSLRVLLLAALVIHATTGWLTALVAAGAGRAVLGLAALALVANVLGNLLLIPALGGTGAAAATLGTELLLSGGAWWTLRHLGEAPAPPLRRWALAVPLLLVAALASAGLGRLLA